jgi:hypothetical protein
VFQKFDTAGALRVRSEFDNQIVARDYHLIVRIVLECCAAALLRTTAAFLTHSSLLAEKQPARIPLHWPYGRWSCLHISCERLSASSKYLQGGHSHWGCRVCVGWALTNPFRPSNMHSYESHRTYISSPCAWGVEYDKCMHVCRPIQLAQILQQTDCQLFNFSTF